MDPPHCVHRPHHLRVQERLGTRLWCCGHLGSKPPFFRRLITLGTRESSSISLGRLDRFPQLPTCILATNIIFPFTRNDVFFSTVFFLTRILFHIILITSYLSPNGRATGTLTGERAVLPGVFLLGALPMHVVWFVNSIKGQIRRARQRKATLSKVDEQTSKVERSLDDKVAIANSDSEAEKNAQAQPPLFSSLPNPLYYSRRMAGQLYGRSRTGSPAPRPGSPVPRAGSPIPGGAEGDQYRFIPRMRTGAAIGSVRRMGGNLRRRIDSVVAAF